MQKCLHPFHTQFDGQNFCLICGEEVPAEVTLDQIMQKGMEESGFFDAEDATVITDIRGETILDDDMDDDVPNFSDDDSLRPGGYDLNQYT